MKRLKRHRTTLVFLASIVCIVISVLMDPGVEGAAKCRPDAQAGGPPARKDAAASLEVRVGIVEDMGGPVVIRGSVSRACRLARAGDPVLPGQIVQTLAGSRCRLKLMGRDIVNLASDTVFQVDEFSLDTRRGKRHSLFTLYRGAALFYLPLLLEHPNSRAAVRTPNSIAMADSTKFALDVSREDAPGRAKSPRVRVFATCFSGELELKHHETGARVTVAEGFTSVSDHASTRLGALSDPDYVKGLLRKTLGFKLLGPYSTATIVARIR